MDVKSFTNNLDSNSKYVDPGTGPSLHHMEVKGSLQITCKADNVFPLPLLTLGLTHDPGPGDTEGNHTK